MSDTTYTFTKRKISKIIDKTINITLSLDTALHKIQLSDELDDLMTNSALLKREINNADNQHALDIIELKLKHQERIKLAVATRAKVKEKIKKFDINSDHTLDDIVRNRIAKLNLAKLAFSSSPTEISGTMLSKYAGLPTLSNPEYTKLLEFVTLLEFDTMSETEQSYITQYLDLMSKPFDL